MPEFGELALLLAVGVPLALVIARPLRKPILPAMAANDESLELRRRIALESLRDLEADHRAGSLTEPQYQALRDEAEARAAAAIEELEALEGRLSADTPRAADTPGAASRRHPRRIAAGLGALIGAALVGGMLLPRPLSLANGTVVNQRLAEARAAEEARSTRIERLLAQVAENPRDPDALSDLADEYLAGSSEEELVKAAYALLALIALDPDNVSAHVRVASAYVRAGDLENASRATDSLAELVPDSAEVPFLRGLIAFKAGKAATAVEAFDRFLELAPDDARASMVRSLRAEAAGQPASGE